MNKGKNSENSFNTKNQEFGLITCHFKNLISPKPTWNCQRSRICSRKLTRCITAHSSAHISDFFFKFLKKCFKHGHGNLVQITSTAQVELSKLNFNFDDIRIYFLQVLRDCRQNFRHAQWILSVKRKTNEIKITPLFLTDNIKMDKILSNQNFLHCVSSFEGISYNNL